MCSNEQEFHDGDGARSDAAWRIQNRNATRVGSVTCQNAKKHHDGEDVLEEDEFEACAMDQAEATQRMSSEENNKGAKLNTVGSCGVK